MRPLLIMAAVAVLTAGSLLHFRYGFYHQDYSAHAFGADDAYISYRYARNLVDGHGLVFNPGERVEGYSNFIYTLSIAVGLLVVPWQHVYGFSVALNIALAAATLLMFIRGARRRSGEGTAVIAGTLLACTPPMWLWTASGLEVPLVLLAQVGAWNALGDDPADRSRTRPLTAYLGLLVLARADGFVFAIAALVYLAVRGERRSAIVVGATLAAVVAAHISWRLAYYGAPLPNTYYVKVGSATAGARVAAGLVALRHTLQGSLSIPVAALAVAAMRLLTLRRRGAWRPFCAEVVLAASTAAYFVYVGGDRYGERFLMIVYPLGLYVAAAMIDRSAWRHVLSAGVIVLLLAMHVTDPRFLYGQKGYDRWVMLGIFLGAEHPGRVLAVDGAGKIPYFSDLATIDMGGLSDSTLAHMLGGIVEIAHSKSDPDYVLGRQPDLIAGDMRDTFDLLWGLTRAKYTAAGYELKYLCYVPRRPPADPILNVRNLDDPRLKELYAQGYQYAVLSRRRGPATR